jgi:hypothetical protein
VCYAQLGKEQGDFDFESIAQASRLVVVVAVVTFICAFICVLFTLRTQIS